MLMDQQKDLEASIVFRKGKRLNIDLQKGKYIFILVYLMK